MYVKYAAQAVVGRQSLQILDLNVGFTTSKNCIFSRNLLAQENNFEDKLLDNR